MRDLETRLEALGRSVAQPLDLTTPDPAPLLDRARRRRAGRQRLLVAVSSVAALLATVDVLERADPRASATNIAATPDPDAPVPEAEDESPTSTPSPSPSMPRHTATPTTAPGRVAAGKEPAVTPTTTPASGTVTATTGIGGGVWVVGLDGAGLRQVSLDAGPMAWGPTSRAIAVAAGDRIWKLATDDSHRAEIVEVGAPSAVCLDWSSRGDLAWVTSTGDVRIAGPDDAEGRSVLSGGEPDWDARCRWSPDGSILVVGRAEGVVALSPRGAVEWRMDDLVVGEHLAWSPDGRRLAFRSTDPETDEEALVVIDASADDVLQRLPLPAPDLRSLSWDRTGTALLIETRTGGVAHHRVRIADGHVEAMDGAWCCQALEELPDGRWLGFGANGMGRHKTLLVVDPGFSSPQLLLQGRDPRPDQPVMSECRGLYLVEKRVSPNGREVATFGYASYGPHCDSPAF
jgi:hypothetical protein